jgi:hypothetical protein
MFSVILQPGNRDFVDSYFGGTLMIVSVAELTEIIRDGCKLE